MNLEGSIIQEGKTSPTFNCTHTDDTQDYFCGKKQRKDKGKRTILKRKTLTRAQTTKLTQDVMTKRGKRGAALYKGIEFCTNFGT